MNIFETTLDNKALRIGDGINNNKEYYIKDFNTQLEYELVDFRIKGVYDIEKKQHTIKYNLDSYSEMYLIGKNIFGKEEKFAISKVNIEWGFINNKRIPLKQSNY